MQSHTKRIISCTKLFRFKKPHFDHIYSYHDTLSIIVLKNSISIYSITIPFLLFYQFRKARTAEIKHESKYISSSYCCSESQKSDLRGLNIEKFLGEHAPRPHSFPKKQNTVNYKQWFSRHLAVLGSKLGEESHFKLKTSNHIC